MFKNRSVFAWCLYDTGHCAFATIVMAVVLPVYYQNVIAGGEWALSSWGYASSVALARRWVRLLRLGLEGGWKRDAALFG